jgi:AcrR family transcriptional regulator
MAGGSTHGRSVLSKDTRDKLIDAARVLLHRDGYDAVTVRAIASEMGMTTGALYAHFDSKAEVLFAVVQADAASGLFTRQSARSAAVRREAEALLLTVASLSRRNQRAQEVVADVLRRSASVSAAHKSGAPPSPAAVRTTAAGVLLRAAGLDS